MMCLVHGDAEVVIDAFQRHTCAICSRARAKMMRIKRRNKGKDDRHPCESLLSVPVEPFRERLEELTAKGTTLASVAVAAGYVTPDLRRGREGREMPDTQRLQRQLGLTPQGGRQRDPATGARVKRYAESVSYEVGLRLCRAMGVEYPAEMGL